MSKLGVVMASLGLNQAAQAAHERAIEPRPEYPDVRNNKGVAPGRLGRHEEALAAFENATQLFPQNPQKSR